MLDVGDILVADGHKLAFQVINPFTGKPCRATLVGFLDWKSTALVGYEIMLEENTQCIASALRNAIINLDMIPKIVYQDNGRAFRAKYFTDDKGFTELGFYGLYAKLGIETVFARPYNARAKVIERFFKEFQEGFEKLMTSYVGSSIINKPAYLKRNEKFHQNLHQEFIPTIDETIKMIDVWLKFKNSQPCTNAPNMTIAEVLENRKKQNIDINTLDDLMLATEVKTIQRNGIRFLNCDYFDERLASVIETFEKGKQKIILKNFRKEIELRDSFSSKFIDMQNNHVKYLTLTIEQQFVDEFSAKSERPSAKVIHLYELSKQLALQEKFEEAKALKEEAEQLKINVAKDAQRDVVRTYKAKINDTLQSQENEIAELAKKNEAELKKLEVLKLQQLQDHMNSSKILVSKLHKKFLNTINQLPLTDKEKQTISRYATKRYTEIAVAHKLLDQKEEISPKKPNINPADQKVEKARYVTKREFLHREFGVQFKSQAAQRASAATSKATSQASSRYNSLYDSQY